MIAPAITLTITAIGFVFLIKYSIQHYKLKNKEYGSE